MKEIRIMTIPGLYRDDFRITGYCFGSGKKAACIMGSMRGNEFQQLYVCQQLISRLREMEAEGCIADDRQILVIPCGNPYSINVKSRFWTIDDTDINRMFPGYSEGETTQRIADKIFQAVSEYQYGIQMASFYLSGSFIPHIRVMRTGYEDAEMGKLFGLPYVVIHEPRPFDTATLNYNWQIWGVKAFSLYTTTTEKIDPTSAQQGLEAILQFLSCQGIIRYHGYAGFISRIISTKDLLTVRSSVSGFFEQHVHPGSRVRKDQVIGRITHPYLGDEREQIICPEDSTVFFINREPLVYEATALFKLISNAANRNT